MSLVQALRRQSLIAEKNNLYYNMLQNSAAQRSMLNTNEPSFTGLIEDGFSLSNVNDSTQLMAVNAELNALNEAKIDYLA